jgi:Glycosyl hydrolase family 26
MLRRPIAIVALATIALVPQSALARGDGRAGPAPHLTSGGVQLPTDGALFGVHLKLDEHNGFDRRQAMVDFEALVGRKMAIDREFYNWDDAWPVADDEWSRDQGRILYFSWDPILESNGQCVGWANIANGQYDAQIDAQAAAVIAFGAPVIFSFAHEPTTAPPGGGTCGEPTDYIAAWQHFHDRWVADGVTNVTWALTFTAQSFDRGTAEGFYPGDAYIDVVAADGYNWFGCPHHRGPWRTFEQIFDPFYQFGVDHGKQLIVAEYGGGEDPNDAFGKAKWFTDGADVLKSWPLIKGIAYFNVGGGGTCARYVDSSPESLEAFQTNGADPYFNPPPPIGNVSVTDFAFTPKLISAGQATGIRWTFNGPSSHTVTDSSGMGLFDTGPQSPGSSFVYYFIGAGTYTYQCMIHTQMQGRVQVSPLASPPSGGVTTVFTITYAGNQAPTGFGFDVQIKRPGSANWENWLTNQYDNEATFVPDSGTGTYQFRARYHNTANGTFSKWSPQVSILVS